MSNKSHKRRWKKLWMRRRKPPAAAPGTIAPDITASPPQVSVIAYGPNDFVEERIDDLEKLREYPKKWPVTWINVEGLGDERVLHRIAEMFKLHPLAMEDAVNVHQRAKVEEYEGQTFIVARMVAFHEHLETEQLAIFLGANYVITFQERPGEDCIEPLRHRLRKSNGRVRAAGADYLVYSLLDAVIDGYFPVLEHYGEVLDTLEDEVTVDPNRHTIGRIHEVKVELLLLRRAIWPFREAVNMLVRDPSPRVHDETRIYLRDCYDHTVQLIDLLETYRELGADLRDLYLSSISNRMNEVIRVLTVISTTFIPLSFLASLYGMNFNTRESPWNMPELNWYFGYPLVLGLMGLIVAGMLTYFGGKGWLASFTKPKERREEK